MKLKRFSTEIFAGINDRSYEFEDGLNILLGNNEAGKSTIINAIYAALFVEPQIKLNRTEGKEFKEQYFPYPDGDHVSAELVFEVENGRYKFYKKWSNSNYQGYLELPDGQRIENTDKIAEYKRDILPYGKSTYSSIVFSSQKDIKSTIERINAQQNPELIDTISSFLRKAVMELDGVSIDLFRSSLEDEIEELTKKWDLNSKSPANSDRGLNNPYKKGTGKIYDAYIAKESLRTKIKETKVSENRFAELTAEIKDMKSREKELLQKIDELELIEADITRRAAAEMESKNIKDQLERLIKVSQKWPENKNELDKLYKRRKELEAELKMLTAEKERAEKIIIKNELKKKVDKIEVQKKELKELKSAQALISVNEDRLEKLEEYQAQINQTEASLKAAKLRAKINFSKSDQILVTAGVEAEKESSPGEKIEADGYLRIKTDQIDIEIESAEIDFSQLQQDFKESKNNFEKLKTEMKVDDLNQARRKFRELREIKSKIEHLEEKIEELLAEKSFQELKNKLQELENLEASGELNKIEKQIKAAEAEKNEVEREIAVREAKIKDWQEEYQSLEEIDKLLRTKKEKQESLKDELDQLTPLPEEYENPEEFKADLKKSRAEKELINQNMREYIEERTALERELPENSTREMQRELESLEEEFKNLNSKAQNLLKIKKVFEAKLEEMDKNSFKPLIKAFSSNLNKLTAGKYEAGTIDDQFRIELRQNQFKKLPANLELLSYGTYDAAALALRFAIFDNLFQAEGGFIVLDDCLVNLDPKRREKAVQIIKEFQQKYQIIYTTCSPQNAKELGGNIIKV